MAYSVSLEVVTTFIVNVRAFDLCPSRLRLNNIIRGATPAVDDWRKAKLQEREYTGPGPLGEPDFLHDLSSDQRSAPASLYDTLQATKRRCLDALTRSIRPPRSIFDIIDPS
jgi:hypothetical protein